MIVIVIMGILVAIAIPIYGAVTENSERKTCHSNCEIIEKAAVQYLLSNNLDNLDALVTKAEGRKTITPEVAAAMPAEFLKCFASSIFPDCPVAGEHYVFVYGTAVDGRTVEVECSKHGGRDGL